MRHTWWCCWYLFSKGHLRDFYFADSNGIWLPRHVIKELDDSIPTAVHYGIGKIEGCDSPTTSSSFGNLASLLNQVICDCKMRMMKQQGLTCLPTVNGSAATG